MARKKSKKAQKQEESANAPGAELNEEFYDQLGSFDVYATEKKTTKIFGVRNKKPTSIDPNLDPYLKARTKSKTPRGWKYITGIDLHASSHVARFIFGLLALAKKIGWKVKQSEDIEQLKGQLRDSEETILRLENSNKDLREKHDELMVAFRTKQEQLLHSRLNEFKDDAQKLSELITSATNNKVSEQELQEFLYNHPWLFGTEYVNAEPQKLRGAHNRFDFYLERFNKTNDIVEIKLLSEPIITADGKLGAKVSQAVDQLIDYMEGAQAAAHSRVIAEEEGIYELRPRGIVIIGSDSSSGAKEKLQRWNYQFAHITILTYRDVLDRAHSVLRQLVERENLPK